MEFHFSFIFFKGGSAGWGVGGEAYSILLGKVVGGGVRLIRAGALIGANTVT